MMQAAVVTAAHALQTVFGFFQAVAPFCLTTCLQTRLTQQLGSWMERLCRGPGGLWFGVP